MTPIYLPDCRPMTPPAAAPCLHRIEDNHVSGLPLICTLDKGHDGPHSDEA